MTNLGEALPCHFTALLNHASSTLPVADLEGVPWVPWNPSFEGLPL